MNDLDLLKKYEPILHFTRGELFFPCAVEGYIRHCSLWSRDKYGHKKRLATKEYLSLDNLEDFSQVPPEHTLYLHFVETPLDAIEYNHWMNRPDRPRFRASGRLARVGLFARILDSVFDISLLLRGTVPGGTTARAEIQYRNMLESHPRPIYYSRVLRRGGYIILHYLFFYVMNSWRSLYYGVNDHEADWEQIFVYLCDDEANPEPCWVAASMHDYTGDDLRRRWDDPELQKQGTHPVIYVGAGSHASYFQSGEYLMRVQPPLFRPVKNLLGNIQKWWREKLGQGESSDMQKQLDTFLRVPFIDYARGDGKRIGKDQEQEWNTIVLDTSLPWVNAFRGLWGLDTRDFLSSERAPAGPKYNRDGTVRTSWQDPLAWAGLEKVVPKNRIHDELSDQIHKLEKQAEQLSREFVAERQRLRELGMQVQALRVSAYHQPLYEQQQAELESKRKAVLALHDEIIKTEETIQATREYLGQIENGEWGDPQSHIRNKHIPEPGMQPTSRFLELWGAVSNSIILLGFVSLMIWDRSQWFEWIVLLGGLFFALESIVRGRLVKLLHNVTILLALFSGLVLLYEFWWYVLLVLLIGAIVVMMRENLREVFKS